MFELGQLTRCQERKAVLLRQIARHRRVLIEEAQNLRPVASWVDLGMDLVRKARTGWRALASVLPFWQMRKQPRAGLVQKLTAGILVGRSLWSLWKRPP